MFGFQRLDVYQAAIRFLTLAAPIARDVPRDFSSLGDQLRRAAPLSAEGNGRPQQDARRFYSFARGSALECAAILDVLEALGTNADRLAEQRELLRRVDPDKALRHRAWRMLKLSATARSTST